MVQQWYDMIASDSSIELYRAIGSSLLAVIAASLVMAVLQRIFPLLYRFIRSKKGTLIRTISIGSFRLLSEDSAVALLFTVVRGLRFILAAAIIYPTLQFILTLFPWTGSEILRDIASGSVAALFILIVSGTLIRGMLALHRFVGTKLSAWRQTRQERVIGLQLLSTERIVDGLTGLNSLVRVIGFTMTMYLTLTLVFNQFPATAQWSSVLWGYIMDPVTVMYGQFTAYLPKLFTVAFILLVVRYLLKFVRFLFYEAEQGTIVIPGFHPEWAEPTYQISRFLIFAFAMVVIFPYLPGADTPFFQGISVFVGVLLSFGSSSAISNVVSGTVLTYMRPFKRGDVVQIGETTGEVIEKSLLVTRVRTPKNVDVTIPNSSVLNGHIVNYSAQIGGAGLILNTTVTIGYDVPWSRVHALLIAAAEKSEGIRKEPKPFVLQTALNDSHISYELNAFTDTPVVMPWLYSELHKNIQAEFNAANVEIMSPFYAAVRDGNASTVPGKRGVRKQRKPGRK